MSETIKWGVWLTHIGRNFDGECFVCSRSISVNKWKYIKRLPLTRDGTPEDDNLRPICEECHFSIGDTSIVEYLAFLQDINVAHSADVDEVSNVKEISVSGKTCKYIFKRGELKGKQCSKHVNDSNEHC